MTPVPVSQLTLNLEPSVVDRWATLRDYVSHRLPLQQKLAKTVAADMDISPSLLSKKLAQRDDNRFTCDDLEGYLASTGDVVAVIEYLAAKFQPGGDAARKARAIGNLEALGATLARTLAAMKDETA